MNPQLLQMLLPYLMQLFQGGGAGGQNPLATLFGQNAQNGFMQPAQPAGPTGSQNALQPTGGASASAPGSSVGPVTVTDPGQASVVPSPQNQISPTGAPQSLNGIWNSLFAGMQNNSLTAGQSLGGQPTGATGFGLGG